MYSSQWLLKFPLPEQGGNFRRLVPEPPLIQPSNATMGG
jgi:hypothetical protein